MNIREYSSFIICITLSVYFISLSSFFNLFQDVITFKNVITFVITMSVNCISGKAMKWTHLRIHLGPFWRGGYYYLMDRLPNLPIISYTIISYFYYFTQKLTYTKDFYGQGWISEFDPKNFWAK